jgi:FHS family L-fucose permease-like MFS transporter
LIINGAVNTTDVIINNNQYNNFTLTLQNGQYNWGVNCTDNSTNANIGNSLIYNLTVDIPPDSDNDGIPDSQDMLAGNASTINSTTSLNVYVNSSGNLSQAFNSFGTTIGPLIGGWLIFKVFTRPGMHGAESVKVPYLCFAAVFLLLAVCFRFVHLPSFTNKEGVGRGAGALKYPHTVLGMVAIFMYVGGEVAVGSAIINFLGTERLGSLPHEVASRYLAFYWGGLMIGRFMGAFALSDMRRPLKHSLVILVPVAAFGTIALSSDLTNALHYGVFLAILLGLFFLGEASPHRMLTLFSGMIILLLATGMLTAGQTAQWTILSVGLFCSVMWSNIFALAIEGLGPLKSQASSLLVMAIFGGAVLPPLQGQMADRFGIQFSFIVPMMAFGYIAFYGLYGYRAGRHLTLPAGK